MNDWYVLSLTDAERDALFAFLWPAALDVPDLADVVSRVAVLEPVGMVGDTKEDETGGQ